MDSRDHFYGFSLLFNIWQKKRPILGFHVTSEKNKVKNFRFLFLSGKSYF